MIDRRRFLCSSIFTALAANSARGQAGDSLPIGHRQASMNVAAGPQIFDLARQIPGLTGVELQVHFKGTTLWDRETALSYKTAGARAGIALPSISGIWPKGDSLLNAATAEENIRKAIQAAELLGSKVVLVVALGSNCPKMDDEQSYGPVVKMLQNVSSVAGDAGITLGMETSLSPEGNKNLIDLVNRLSVKVYYDLFNVENLGHAGQSVPGLEVLGKSRICQIHMKNGKNLLEEPGPVNWVAAIKGLKRIGYQGWFFFETSHSSQQQCIEATKKNIAFLRKNFV
jgi:sugar phosphate isomerase/epimerase